jgi:Fe-S-cluster containining protein
VKPISCALYPIREKTFSDGTVALNYHKWDICKCGREKGKALHLPVYQFLKGPLVRRFGEQWYQELCDVASDLKQQGYL